ncbi:MAG: hypothetical protein WC900_07485 [Oscillospiraceae bacterium]|jgi:hypothetical protein
MLTLTGINLTTPLNLSPKKAEACVNPQALAFLFLLSSPLSIQKIYDILKILFSCKATACEQALKAVIDTAKNTKRRIC